MTAKTTIVERWGGSVKEDWGLKVSLKPADHQDFPGSGGIGSLRRKGDRDSPFVGDEVGKIRPRRGLEKPPGPDLKPLFRVTIN